MKTNSALVARLRKIVTSDTGRIVSPCGRLFYIIGFNRHTKDGPYRWLKNGKLYNFAYVEERVIASGKNPTELEESATKYAKLVADASRVLRQAAVSPAAACGGKDVKHEAQAATAQRKYYVWISDLSDNRSAGRGVFPTRPVRLVYDVWAVDGDEAQRGALARAPSDGVKRPTVHSCAVAGMDGAKITRFEAITGLAYPKDDLN